MIFSSYNEFVCPIIGREMSRPALKLNRYAVNAKYFLSFHRKENGGDGDYNAFAGPYDLTVVKVDQSIKFVPGKVKK